jgi:hypothetical protein
MDYEELIKQLEEENAHLRKESKYWQDEALKFMARLTEVLYWYEGDAENVFGEEGEEEEEEDDEEEEDEEEAGGTQECKHEDEEDEDEDEGEEEEDEEEEEEDTWREWWDESGDDWKKWWDIGVKQLEW